MGKTAQVIGKRIRNYRNQKGWSQEELAEHAGCHATYIGQIERGEKNATIESIAKIAAALGIPLSRLFELIGEDVAGEAYARRCYERILSRSPAEQKELYELLEAIVRYHGL